MARGESGLFGLALDALRTAALERAEELGCSDAVVRVQQSRNQSIALRDGVVEGTADELELGVGVRIVLDGAFGFAGTVETDPGAVRDLVDAAASLARLARSAGRAPVELAPEPSHGHHRYVSPHVVDPTSVPDAEKIATLEQFSRRLLASRHVDHVSAALYAVVEDVELATLSGTTASQRRVRVAPFIEALALDGDGGSESMASCAPPVGRGLEYLSGDGWDFDAELDELPELLAEKLRAPMVEPGRYDLVIDPTNLWLTIHESVGHATELDRALGFEAAYAGTSFATFDQLGSLRYGSPLMQVRGDRVEPYGLATVAIDDEGVPGSRFELVDEGVLVGYQLDRAIAATAGLERSNGCAYACSPLRTPIQRMANVSLGHGGADGPTTSELIAGVERGLYVVGDKSWSIDMQRYNFQFTGQRFFRIEGGRLVGQVRNVAYQATTTDFWGSLSALGGASTYLLGGTFSCGKGQPPQSAPVSHGCPAARFDQVNVLNTWAESGR